MWGNQKLPCVFCLCGQGEGRWCVFWSRTLRGQTPVFQAHRFPAKEPRWLSTPCASPTPRPHYNAEKSWSSGRMAAWPRCTKPERRRPPPGASRCPSALAPNVTKTSWVVFVRFLFRLTTCWLCGLMSSSCTDLFPSLSNLTWTKSTDIVTKRSGLTISGC